MKKVKKKAIQYGVLKVADDGCTEFFNFYDSIIEAVQDEQNEGIIDVKIWKFEGEVLGTYRMENVVKKVKG